LPADDKGRGSNPIQEIFWTRTGLLLLILIVVAGGSMAISAAMSPGTAKNVVAALATGTLITAIVSFGQTLITAKAAQRAMVTPLIEENRRTLRELSAEYRALNREFFPTNEFEPTNEPDPTLNHLMMEDLRNTRQYFFRGFSGRYAAARLLLARSDWELRAVVADPHERTAITGRARYLVRHEGSTLADFDSIQSRLHEEIHIGLVGLFLARSRCSRIDVAVVADPPLDRLEMFDDSVWITLYSDAGATMLYPRTLRFSEGSFIYNMERAEFDRLHNTRGARHLVITPNTTRTDFAAQFEMATGTKLTERRFRDLESRFHAFRLEFSLAADLGS
jgi:hypothetical protein